MDWVKSSFCAADKPQCVEVRRNGPDVEIRDSKFHDDSSVLVFTSQEWDAFVAGVKNGDFDRLGEKTPELV